MHLFLAFPTDSWAHLPCFTSFNTHRLPPAPPSFISTVCSEVRTVSLYLSVLHLKNQCARDCAKATISAHQWIKVHGGWQATCYPWAELNLLSHIFPSNAAWKGRNPITNKFTHFLTFSCWEWWVMVKPTCSVLGSFPLPIFLKISSG